MQVSVVRITVALVLWLLLMVCLVAFYWWRWLHADHDLEQQQRYFVVAKGESVHSVAQRLYQTEVIRWPTIWRLYARFFDPAPIKAGEYLFARRETPASMLDALQEGDVITYRVTLVEGLRFTDYVATLAAEEKLQSQLGGLPMEQQLEILDLDISHPEGWFYPDTYQYVAGDTDSAILRRAHRRMRDVLAEQWQGRAADLPYETPYEALVMASIVEKETGVPSERREIAGVFVRRLQRGMRLQTDPTVIYGLGALYQGNLTKAHLRQSNAYNTYTVSGLPPTPIAMPGGAAIHAALHPLAGDSLYFVAKGDGSHQFSATLELHNQAVQKYQRSNRVENYRSAPPPEAANGER